MQRKGDGSPLVSIVTPSLNQGRFLERTILSVLQQDYPNIQYILVDGGSNDETLPILSKHCKHLSKLIVESDNGQSQALNKGFACAEGQILAWLNADDCYADAGVVSHMVARLLESDLDMIYGRRCRISASGSYIQGDPFRLFNSTDLLTTCYIPQECSFWTREIYEQVGCKIDESLDFAMDYDLWYRFLRKGAKIQADRKVCGLFRWYPEQKSRSKWTEVGLPEVKRIHRKYLGFELEERELFEFFNFHFYGSRLGEATEHSLLAEYWRLENTMRQRLLATGAIDRWMFY